MKYIRWILAAGMAFALQQGSGRGQDSSPNADEIKVLLKRIEDLEQKVKQLEESKSGGTNAADTRLQELDQKVKGLEKNREFDQAEAQKKTKAAPVISVGGEGFTLNSANGDFKLQLKGLLQVDSRTFFNDTGIAGNDTFLIRRMRPIFQGSVFKDFDFLLVPDFGGTSGPQLFDAYVNYRYNAAFQLQAGKYKMPVGLEMLQPDNSTWFNERSLATDLVPNRDVGIELHGDLWGGAVSYAAGIFNGVGDARNSSNADFEDDKAFAGRVFFQPFKSSSLAGVQGLGFGLAGSYESMQKTNTAGLPATTGGTLGGFTTDGQQQFFAYNPASNAVVVASGEHWRLSPQTYYSWGPFALMGEYVISNQRVTRTVTAPFTSARLEHTAWEISGSWILTGEDSLYGSAINPRNPFKPVEGGWGAWQLVARYAELEVDRAAFPLFSDPRTSAHTASSWSVGLNWYLNRNFCLKSSYSHTDFSGGGIGTRLTAPGAVSARDESVLFTRLQLYF